MKKPIDITVEPRDLSPLARFCIEMAARVGKSPCAETVEHDCPGGEDTIAVYQPTVRAVAGEDPLLEAAA